MHTFSVLAYKESPFLEECLESLTQQTCPSSIIICTSTPSDFVRRIADQFKVPLAVNPSHIGIAGDWNFAYDQACSPYVTLAHQDDFYESRYTEKLMEAARRTPDNIICFCDYIEQFENTRKIHTCNLFIKRVLLALNFAGTGALSSPARKKLLLSLGSPITCPSVMFHKERIPSFRFSSDFSVDLDWDAWLRLAECDGSFAFVREKLLVHRLHPLTETSAGIGDNRRATEDILLFGRIWPDWLAKVIAKFYGLSYLGNTW